MMEGVSISKQKTQKGSKKNNRIHKEDSNALDMGGSQTERDE